MQDTNPWLPGKPSSSAAKEAERQKLESKIDQFLKSGGRIQQVAQGVSGFDPRPQVGRGRARRAS